MCPLSNPGLYLRNLEQFDIRSVTQEEIAMIRQSIAEDEHYFLYEDDEFTLIKNLQAIIRYVLMMEHAVIKKMWLDFE